MSVVDLATAKQDLRVEHDADDALIQRLLNTAERYVVHFIGRNLYADQVALDAAKAGADEAFLGAKAAYQTALDEAGVITDFDLRYMKTATATSDYQEAVVRYDRTMAGVVVDDTIKTAITLTTADLYEHRGDEELPTGVPASARTYLWTYRWDLPL